MPLVQSFIPITKDDCIYRAAQFHATTHQPIYEGWAKPGTADSAIGWRLVKHTLASGYISASNYPKKSADVDGNSVQTNEFCFVWDSRAGYTYTA